MALLRLLEWTLLHSFVDPVCTRFLHRLGNGEIDYIEFLTATTELNKLQTVENIQHAFAQMDTNGDGRITVSEVCF